MGTAIFGVGLQKSIYMTCFTFSFKYLDMVRSDRVKTYNRMLFESMKSFHLRITALQSDKSFRHKHPVEFEIMRKTQLMIG